MKFKRLTSAAGADFEPAFDLYGVSFPIHEQRLIESQRSIMTHPEYLFDLIYDDSGEWCGDMLYWETADFIYVEHFCILPERRGQRCGQRALELLCEKGKTVILEIDPPSDKTSVRRKGFYERCGYHANPFAHVHPPYRVGFDGHGHRLVIMSYPRELSQDEYDRFNEYLKNVVMRQAADTSFEGIAQEIKTRIDRLLDTQPRVIIAIDGRCGAGKSTLAARLAELCGGNVFHMDDFFLRSEQRTPERFAEPGGNVDRERFETEVLAPLAAGQAAQYRPWDCHTGDFAVAYAVEPAQLTIVEGSYSMHPALRGYYDCMICLAVDPAEQLRRLERRNPRMLQRFVDEWIPLENRYFEATNIQAVADLLVDTALPDGGSVVEPV